MAVLPASGALSDDTNTVPVQKQAFEDFRDVLSQVPGVTAESELTISAGSITPPTRNGGVHTVDTETDASTDNLDTIDQSNVPDGRLLLLRAADPTRTVVIRHNQGGAGQILLQTDVDYSLDDINKFILLLRVGTDWVEVMRNIDPALNQPSGVGVLAPHKNLTISQTSVTAIDVDADELVLTADNDEQVLLKSWDLTVDITTNGINGAPRVTKTGTYSTTGTSVSGTGSAFDTEFEVGDVLWSDTEGVGRRITAITNATTMTVKSAYPTDVSGDNVVRNGEAPETFFHVHAIWNGTTKAAILDTREVVADVPAGYTHKGLVGAIRNNVSGNIVDLRQVDRVAHMEEVTLVSDTSAASPTQVDASIGVPTSAKNIFGWCSFTGSAGAFVDITPTSTANFARVSLQKSSADSAISVAWELAMPTPQTIWWESVSTTNVTIKSTGWRY